MPRKTTTYRRATLYDEVWAEPVQTVARRYGVSDVALAKVCRRLAVPLPPRGYWARVAAGQNPKRPLLPKAKSGTPGELTTSRRDPNDPSNVPPEHLVDRVAIENVPERKIVVPDNLEKPHRLVASASRILRRLKVRDYGRVERPAETCLHIEVGPASLDRALRLVDTLLKESEARGYEVSVTPYVPASTRRHGNVLPSNQSRITVEGVPIWFRLRERSSAKEDRRAKKPARESRFEDPEWWLRHGSRSDFVGNGTFELTMSMGYSEVVWADGKSRRLEDRLNEVFAKLPLLANERHERDAKELRRQAEERAAADRRRAETQRAAEEQRRVDAFTRTLEKWRLARDVREFVDEVRRSVSPEKVGIDGYLAWALAYADRIDPVAALARRDRDETGDDFPVDDEEE